MTGAAVLLCGHGSRDPDAIAEFERIAAALRLRLPQFDLAVGYLEFARPTIRDSLAGLAARGARHILAIPAMLSAASHVKTDLPREIAGFNAGAREVEVRLGRDLGIEPRLVEAARDRIVAAVDDRVPRARTLLVVVGRGSRDPEANAAIAKLARILQERMGFGGATAVFAGVADPRADPTLDSAGELGFRRIIVFPYFLCTGVLVKRISASTDAAARRFPGTEFRKAAHLSDHRAVIEALDDRVEEGLAAILDNC